MNTLFPALVAGVIVVPMENGGIGRNSPAIVHQRAGLRRRLGRSVRRDGETKIAGSQDGNDHFRVSVRLVSWDAVPALPFSLTQLARGDLISRCLLFYGSTQNANNAAFLST